MGGHPIAGGCPCRKTKLLSVDVGGRREMVIGKRGERAQGHLTTKVFQVCEKNEDNSPGTPSPLPLGQKPLPKWD